MLPASIIESNEQLIKAYKCSVSLIPNNEIIDMEGISIVGSNTDSIMLNPIFISNKIRDEADLEARLKTIVGHIKKSKFPWMVIVCEDFLPEAIKSRTSEIFARYELGFLLKLAGMAADKLVPYEKQIPELECRLIENEEMAIAAGEINAIAYDFPLDSFSPLFAIEEYWQKRLFGYLGYVEDKPVCVGTTLENDGQLYVVWIATLPEYRNKGYAKKVVWRSLQTAREKTGLSSSVLHATEGGAFVYKKLGFSPVSSFQCFYSNKSGN